MRKYFLILLAIAFAYGLILGGSTESAAQGKELKISSLSVLTGPGSPGISPQAIYGVVGAADWINSKGGLTIKGEKYRVKILMEDSKDSADGMVAATNKAVYQDNVKFVVNCTPSMSILKAVLPMLQKNKVIVVNGEGLGVREYVFPEFNYLFYSPMCTSAYMCTLDVFKKLYPNVKSFVSMTTEGDEFQKEVKQIEQALALDSKGPQIVNYGTYPMGSSDYYPVWTKALASPKKADGIIMCMGIAQWYAGVRKQGGELGFNKPFVGLGIGADPYIVADIAGQYATDMLLAAFDFKSPAMTPEIKEAIKFIKDKFNQEMTAAIFIGWEQMVILADVIEKAQSLDSTVVKDYWEKMTSINTPAGKGKMGGAEYYGINHVVIRPMPMSRIMNGKVEHYGWGDGSLPPVRKAK
jgi:ABC-type branched-subunit amino acid transport system substrate-binding protein